MRVELPGKVGFHQPVEELDVLRQRRGELIGRAVLIGRCDRADEFCLLYTSPSPRDRTRSRMPSSA